MLNRSWNWADIQQRAMADIWAASLARKYQSAKRLITGLKVETNISKMDQIVKIGLLCPVHMEQINRFNLLIL